MKFARLLLLSALLISIVCLPISYIHYKIEDCSFNENFFFGVTYGLNTTSEAKLLIDKVKEYTNLFVLASWDISTNETALNEVCDYAVDAKMSIIIYYDFISYAGFPWLQTWLDTAKERWGGKFLGIYLYDEPGGRQIDNRQWDEGRSLTRLFANVSDYTDAANRFVTSIPSSFSMQNVKNSSLPVFTSDYALYWFDYLAGYDTVFVELGWNHSETQHIALNRGAANVQNKEWGAMITWTYESPPYLENGTRLLEDMKTVYLAGAKYLGIFNFPRYPETNQYGILGEEHFQAMKQFWIYIHRFPRSAGGKVEDQVAFVLPEDYGWGMRNPNDKIWGIWPPDDLSPLIWNNMNKLIEKYGLKLDIIYYDTRFNFEEKYSKIYFWNSTVD